MKAVQKFTKEYLEHCQSMSPAQIIGFLEQFRQLQEEKMLVGKSQLISMKIPKPLLDLFQVKCRMNQVPYQTQIKRLMLEWLR